MENKTTLAQHCFRVALATGNVDLENGTIADVSILTATEAKGHGILVDKLALKGALKLLKGKRLPAFITHNGAGWSDRMLGQVGYFESFRIEGDQLKARTFQALGSFMQHEAPAFERLFDIAQEMPETFGVSIVFNGSLFWLLKDGTETRLEDESRPAAGLKYPMPVVRFSEISSADFVDAPAANPAGLLEAARKLSDQPKNQPKPEDPTMENEQTNDQPGQFSADTVKALEALPAEIAALQEKAKIFEAFQSQAAEIAKRLEEQENALSALSKLMGAEPNDTPDTTGDPAEDAPGNVEKELSAAEKLRGKSGKTLFAEFQKNKGEILAAL